MGLHKTKSLLHSQQEETINKIKEEHTEWENIFANDTSDRDLISKNI